MTKMRVCVVGDFSGVADEGMKNTARYFAQALQNQGVKVKCADVTDVFQLSFVSGIREFDPDIIHYVPGIGMKNLFLMALLKKITGAKAVISAIHPKFIPENRIFLNAVEPDLVFTQNKSGETPYDAAGWNTEFLANGVDIERFTPLSGEERLEARSRFDFEPDQYIVLHVGHLTAKRGLEALIDLQKTIDQAQVIIAASDHFETKTDLVKRLNAAGCRIVEGYVPNIEELYAAADCYVFPTQAGDTIQTPLSVLEAMACNLPVVTLRHPGIAELFDPGDGFHLCESAEDIIESVAAIKSHPPESSTRLKVKKCSWDVIAENAVEQYQAIFRKRSGTL